MQGTSGLVAQLFFDPQNVGEATEPNFSGRAASFQCGAALRITLHIDGAQRITEAKFKAAGCSLLVASASLLLDQATGKTTAEAAMLGRRPEALAESFGASQSECSDCPALACTALVSAIQHYSDSTRSGWEGDEALICTCFCVSERTIERQIHELQLRTISAVTAACNAGAGCRSCYPLIQDALDVHWHEQELKSIGDQVES